jgi:hypothetical protein
VGTPPPLPAAAVVTPGAPASVAAGRAAITPAAALTPFAARAGVVVASGA